MALQPALAVVPHQPPPLGRPFGYGVFEVPDLHIVAEQLYAYAHRRLLHADCRNAQLARQPAGLDRDLEGHRRLILPDLHLGR